MSAVESGEPFLTDDRTRYHYYAVDGKLGTAGTKPTCTPTDADPNNGTDDYAESVAQMSKRSTSGWTSRSRLARA